ncbi:unnamed protein product, partial [Fusarium graminearum]
GPDSFAGQSRAQEKGPDFRNLTNHTAGWLLFTQAPGSWGSRESSEHCTTTVHTGAVPVLYVCCKSWAMPRYTKRLESDLTRCNIGEERCALLMMFLQHAMNYYRLFETCNASR